MVATEGVVGKERGLSREEEILGGRKTLPFFSAHPPPQAETSYNAINLVPRGEIWQLSEFYTKILPPLTVAPPVSQHLSEQRASEVKMDGRRRQFDQFRS